MLSHVFLSASIVNILVYLKRLYRLGYIVQLVSFNDIINARISVLIRPDIRFRY